jgi:hypothetical protein
MSTDAGKVYFVLYLAVVLELLIIIVERDEAEEHLLRKQKESMKIVESILSQLQSGSGTEGINTRPQDEITLPPPGINIEEVMGAELKSWRSYVVEVGVTDISNDLKMQYGETEKDYHERLKKLVELANVEEIEYQIFYSPSDNPNNAPLFPNDDEIYKKYKNFKDFQPGQTVDIGDGLFWEFLSTRRLKLDKDATYNSLPLSDLTPESVRPIYPKENIYFNGESFVPKEIPEDSVFFYSERESIGASHITGTKEFKKRAFVVNFQPPQKQGWYKLRFSSRTNRILGVRGGTKLSQIDKNTKVNIGTVQLTVEALEKVKKELSLNLERFLLPPAELLVEQQKLEEFDEGLRKSKAVASQEEDAVEIRGKIDLYGYIVKLLAPGQSVNFDQNRGSIEFNIRVITPTPPIAEPVISVPTYSACFDKIPPAVEFTISPYQGRGTNTVEGRILDPDGAVVARLNCQPLEDIASVDVTPPTTGGRQEWRGIVDKELPPGKYKLEITHKLHSKSKIEVVDLEVFPTGLTKDNKREIDTRLDLMTYYGYNIIFNAIATSGGKIKSNQFRIYLTSDQDQQRPPFEGLSMGRNEGLFLSSDINEVSVMISWIQPYTNREVVLYPKKTVPVNQQPPRIITDNLNHQESGTEKKIRIRITNISLTKPLTGGDAKADIKTNVKNPKIEINGYDIASDPLIEPDGDNFVITMEITGNMERGEDMIFGEVSCVMEATAINPMNGKAGTDEKKISVSLSYEPEKILRRPAGGGARPPRR